MWTVKVKYEHFYVMAKVNVKIQALTRSEKGI